MKNEIARQGHDWHACWPLSKQQFVQDMHNLLHLRRFQWCVRCRRHLFGIWHTSCSSNTMTKPVAFSFTTKTIRESSEKIYTSSISSIVKEFEAEWDSHIFLPHNSAAQAPLKTVRSVFYCLLCLTTKIHARERALFFAQHQPRAHKTQKSMKTTHARPPQTFKKMNARPVYKMWVF